MNRPALIAALVMALLGGFLLFGYMRRFEDEASGGAPVKILVARKQIEPGTIVTEDLLATRLVPTAYVETGGSRSRCRRTGASARWGWTRASMRRRATAINASCS